MYIHIFIYIYICTYILYMLYIWVSNDIFNIAPVIAPCPRTEGGVESHRAPNQGGQHGDARVDALDAAMACLGTPLQ